MKECAERTIAMEWMRALVIIFIKTKEEKKNWQHTNNELGVENFERDKSDLIA